MSEMLRRLQTGSVRTYAASLFAGVVLILGYYLWRLSTVFRVLGVLRVD